MKMKIAFSHTGDSARVSGVRHVYVSLEHPTQGQLTEKSNEQAKTKQKTNDP